ncbi:MAG: bifunctional 23S rRNA (guanine(2069)-N(7))-methyltransferase RlmK/23S rRNA (guanine(2445)-N(2))-methyltransferase RlmL [Coriobacteriia bacterium]|nr:bifunctional 23S rRNA (guanine(2069)-N(7))-methyltransferase RlmK/23S rRNA (guanine(2445)-N(2))-methyltransferase RlmL [Coriobacteriia bacterium]
MRFFAPVARNLETILGDELRAIGVGGVRPATAGVSFEGGLEAGYRACLWSRFASRILMPIARYDAPDEDALYEGALAVPWEEHFALTSTFAIDASVRDSAITHSGYAGLKVKDAIADHFRECFGERPSVDTDAPDILINLALRRGVATLSLDMSGEPLHRRGYRRPGVQTAAPLKETLAAGVLALAGWRGIAVDGGALLDPMCGSGTLLVEAALMAGDIAPGLRRTRWGFKAWTGHEPEVWDGLIDEAMERAEAGIEKLPPIEGSDIDPDAIEIARGCIARAGLDGLVSVGVRDVREVTPPHSAPRGLLVTNLPYGERLTGDLESLYTALGERERRVFGGWRTAVLLTDRALEARLGMHVDKRYELMNGRIPIELVVAEVPKRSAGTASVEDEGAAMFANRLRKRMKHLGKWARREGVTCYRVYDADLPEYSVAIDLYEGRWAHISEYAPPATVDADAARQRLAAVMRVTPEVLGIRPEDVFLKVRQRQRGTEQYERAGTHGETVEVHEGASTFLVNFTDYLDTGLFLDHRPMRKRIMAEAEGKLFLNLFGYTGTMSVAAALGGARQVMTVDLSNTYIEWARANMERNSFEGVRYEYEQADCLQWLRKKRERRFDLIFLDPPSFSNSKRMSDTFDVQRDHVHLITRATDLLAPGGTLYFSTNLRSFTLATAYLEELDITDISAETIPPDFERNPRIHRVFKITMRPS